MKEDFFFFFFIVDADEVFLHLLFMPLVKVPKHIAFAKSPLTSEDYYLSLAYPCINLICIEFSCNQLHTYKKYFAQI